MKKTKSLTGLAAVLAVPAFIVSCTTVGDNAPGELKDAEKSIEQAKAADVEDYMPSAMMAAQQKFDEAVDLSKEAAADSSEGHSADANARQSHAISLANQAKAIADGGVAIVNDMKAFNDQASPYLSVEERETRAAAALAENDRLKQQNKELNDRFSALTAENQRLLAKPAEEVIPAGFKVGKPVAFFASGSTVVGEKYRADIAELANMLKKNDTLSVTLEGFADPRGNAKKNEELSQKRLDAVANLLRQQGVAESKLKLVNVGPTSGTASGNRGELQLDRKVTATITSTAH